MKNNTCHKTQTMGLLSANCHLYHYAGNNPVRYVDPDGLFTIDKYIFEDYANDCITHEEYQRYLFHGLESDFNDAFCTFQSTIDKTSTAIMADVIAGMKFVSDYGAVISIMCYSAGRVEVGAVVDGITVFCDVSLAFIEYADTRDTKKLGKSLAKTLAIELAGKVTGEAGDVLIYNLKKDIAKKIPEYADALKEIAVEIQSVYYDNILPED